jgi:ATP-binding cassette, subfamily B, bacterial PglK
MSVDRTAFQEIASDLHRARLSQTSKQPAIADPSWLGLPKLAIELRNISFRYANERPLIIDRANCTIPAGSLTAIIGANGSGKTTLVDLMLGLLIPESGTIEIDGRNLNPVTQSAWQSTVAYVPQSVFLIDGSLAENIALGMASDEIDPARIEAAVRMSKLDALVTTLPDGLQQRVGAGGQPLSGGERQRVGLARALYRNSSLLVLDEVTGGLDAAGEADLMRLLRSLRGHRTVILVTHGTQNLEQFDAVYELVAGEITLNVCQIC